MSLDRRARGATPPPPRPSRRPSPPWRSDRFSLLDLADNVLNKGVVVTGDVTLALADVDLVFLRLTALLCAADRLVDSPPSRARRSRKRARSRRA